MRKITFIGCLLLGMLPVLAQQGEDTFGSLVEAEMKSAWQISNFTANQNTANYDVLSHVLEFNVDPAEYYIEGTVTTTFRAKTFMTSITFDLTQQLSVNSVTIDGDIVSFTQNADELVISLGSGIDENAVATVVVDYEGEPGFSEGAFTIDTHNGVPELWTLSQPYGAKDWWPCKQDLNDKIDNTDIYITAPSEYVSVGNGLEISQTDNGNGTTTTHFQHNYPIPAYLIAIAVTNYQIFTQTAGTAPNTFPVVNYIYPEMYDFITTQQLPLTVQMIDLFEELFETYPYHEEKYGHAQCSLGGGMEHATVSFMGGFNRELVAHELAHQWFGDKVTCGSWKDIWLNEGFATYLSGLVVEDFDGEAAFTNWKGGRIGNITSQPGGAVYLTDTDTTNVGRIFSGRLSYNKGAMVVHMLRYKLGDADFYQGLKNYLADPNLAFGYAKTPDLKEHLEAASGTDLAEFFNDWVYNQGYPTYNVTVNHWGEGQVKVTINQTQSHSSVSFFEMPVRIRLSGSGGAVQDVLLDNTFNGQEFTVPVNFTVTGVQFNPGNDIISANSQATLNTTEIPALQRVVLYPNPVTGTLHLQLPQGVLAEQAVFYNTLGQKVMETANQSVWNVSHLAQGIYNITLTTNSGTTQLRFVKQ